MLRFEQIQSGIYILRVPFSGIWTGVVLVTGEENCLIDSAASAADVDQFILPALSELGLRLRNITWLLNTHCHGDHLGGHARLKALENIKVAAYKDAAPKVENPIPYLMETRTAFPEYSPVQKCDMKGVQVDKILEDFECITERLQIIHTPGHDNDCVSWYDRQTKTLISGDSLQGNGTPTQGIAFYKYLKEYLDSLNKLHIIDIENIICSHEYDNIGWNIKGRDQVIKCLNICKEYTELYQDFISRNVLKGETNPVTIARKLISEHGCGMPDQLFLALYTVTQHLNYKKN